MTSDALQTVHSILTTFIVIFSTGVLAAKLADVVKLPDIVVYLLSGVLVGSSGFHWLTLPSDSVLNQLLLMTGAAFLLFHGGTGVRVSVLKKVWITLSLLATLAVGMMIVIVGYTAHFVLGISLISALLLAAVLAPTDPAALAPIFLSLKVKERLAQTLLSESAFNDATAAIATVTLLEVLNTGTFSVLGSLSNFAVMAGGGVVIGLCCGLLACFMISHKAKNVFSAYAPVLLLLLVIAAYMTAEHFGGSGFMAVFMAGIVYGNMDELGWKRRESCQEELESFVHVVSLLLRMAIFILLGAHVDFSVVQAYFLPGLVIVAVFMFVARPLAVLACTLPDRRVRWEKREMLFMFWTRETGVIPAALSGMLAGVGVEHADMIAAVTFIAILFTLLLQASTAQWWAKRLNLLE